MEKYGEYATSNKLRSHLGGVEEKVGVARSGGSEKNATHKLKELLPKSEPSTYNIICTLVNETMVHPFTICMDKIRF